MIALVTHCFFMALSMFIYFISIFDQYSGLEKINSNKKRVFSRANPHLTLQNRGKVDKPSFG
jgi:2'-5' RNA ligase